MIILSSYPLSTCFADTSELSFGVEVGGGSQLSPTSLSSARGAWTSSVLDGDSSPQALVSARVGLGLSETHDVWARIGWDYSGSSELSSTNAWACFDSQRAMSLNLGGTLSADDAFQCSRGTVEFNLRRVRIEVGGAWRPFARWSPLVELSTGVLYQPELNEYEVIEGVSDDLTLTPLATGAVITLPARWGVTARAGVGAEVRVQDRWGLRAVAWASGDYAGESFTPTVGLTLGVSYYQYIRLL